MSRIPDDGREVYAPEKSLVWAASYGFVRDLLDVDEVRARPNDVVVPVWDDRWMRDLTGPAPLAAVVRVDRDLQDLTDLVLRFFSGLIDLAEDTAPE